MDQGGAIDVWGEDRYSDCSLNLIKPKCLHHAEPFMPNVASAPEWMLCVLTGAEPSLIDRVSLV